jgi:hypothetical protein
MNTIQSYAQSHNMRARAHNLIWGNQQPTWVNNMLANTGSYTTLRGYISDRIKYYVGDATDGNPNDDPSQRYSEIDVYNESYHTGAGTSSVHRQLTSVSRPDRTSPSEKPLAPKTAYTLNARFRIGPSGNVVVSRDMLAGAVNAAATPFTKRAAISSPGSLARPPSNETTGLPSSLPRRSASASRSVTAIIDGPDQHGATRSLKAAKHFFVQAASKPCDPQRFAARRNHAFHTVRIDDHRRRSRQHLQRARGLRGLGDHDSPVRIIGIHSAHRGKKDGGFPSFSEKFYGLIDLFDAG